MSDEKKEKWLNYLALTTVILAVCATLSTFKGGNFSTRSILSQTQASDQWSYYQSKSIKSYIYDIQKEKLELELRNTGSQGRKQMQDEYREKIAAYAQKVKKYDEEKKEIEAKAKELEKRRDEAQKHSQAFGMAVIFLQIAILLSSVAALLKKKLLWLIGVAAGAWGIVYFANGFLMFM